MFDFVRQHNKIMMGVLFLLIVPSFVLLGVSDYTRTEAKTVVAKVDGREITQAQWDAAHRDEVDRLRASMPQLDVKLLDTPEARYATLDRLVRERVVGAAADKLGLSASNQRLAKELNNNPQIAMLRKADGSLDMEKYQQLLRAQGMSPDMFEASVRAEMSSRQVLNGVAATAVLTTAAADTALGAYFEKRAIKWVRLNPADYAAKIEPTETEIEKFYQDKLSLFKTPESASIEYLVLNADAVAKTLVVSDADLRTFYEQNSQSLAAKEERRVSHILINAPQAAPAAEREAAKAKATAVLVDAKKAPDTFAALARKHSQDTGSASNGGDLNYFARGAMVKPFEDAAFALKAGEISELVETEFGFHILRVIDIKQPKPKSFEDMKPELTAELKKQQLQKKYAEAAEQFTNTVYEQPDSLQPAADKLKLTLQTASKLSRTPSADPKGILSNPKLLAAIFSSESTEKKRNTEAVDVGGGTLVSARITEYSPAVAKPLAEVKVQVKARLVAERSAEEARKDGAAKLAAWQAKPEEAKLPESLTVSRAESRNVAQPLIDAVLRADPALLPLIKGVDLGEQGYVLVQVEKVLPRESLNEAQTQKARQQYTQAWTSAEGLAYYKWLKQRFKAEILVPKPVPESPAKG
jgi:peptidyl-prolyl cis-trans isomerase D